jgi:tetratricopeptide (TPR) repeat protein
MLLRFASLLVCFSGLGCLVLQQDESARQHQLAQQLWEAGQAAMKGGQPEQAIPWYEQSLAADPELSRNHLSLAAAYLEKEDLNRACPHLAEYVEANPDRFTFRLRYAELLARLGRRADSRAQFERCIAVGQEGGSLGARDLVLCHGRLVELALAAEDSYDEHLHRGIGLFLLARQRGALADPEGELPAEGLLCKAAAELSAAHQERPDEARPCLYLYKVWSRLGQQHPALCRLREAQDTGPFTYLTSSEQRDLHLARQSDGAYSPNR